MLGAAAGGAASSSSRSSWVSATQTYWIIDHADDQSAAGTPCNVLLVPQLRRRDLEAVTTRTRVVEDLLRLVELHVLELDFIVERQRHCGRVATNFFPRGGTFLFLMVRPAPVRDARFDLSKWDEPKRASSRKTETSGKKKRAKREVTPEEEPSEVEEQLESDADDGSASEDGDASANDEAREDDAMTDDDDAPEDAYDDSGSDQGAASDQEQDMAGASDDDAHDLHDSEHARQRVLTPESLKEYANKQQKRGIVYVSRIPPGMTPAKVRHIFSQFGEVGRIYLQPKDKEPKGAQKRKRTTANFSEGWVEYLSKRVAKTAAEMMNAQPIGSLGASAHSSRRSQTGSRVANRWKDDIWTMKYLKGFRWPMLIEQMCTFLPHSPSTRACRTRCASAHGAGAVGARAARLPAQSRALAHPAREGGEAREAWAAAGAGVVHFRIPAACPRVPRRARPTCGAAHTFGRRGSTDGPCPGPNFVDYQPPSCSIIASISSWSFMSSCVRVHARTESAVSSSPMRWPSKMNRTLFSGLPIRSA